MSPLLERALALAFDHAPAPEATVAITRVRDARTAAEGREAMSYEVALPALDPDAYLLTKALPKLTYFLDCRGVKPPGSGGVFVSLFSEAGLHFLEAGPLVELLAQARGLTLAELVRRYGAEGAGDPPLLGG